MRTISEWQRAAHELAVSKGFHDCRACQGTGWDEGKALKSAKRDCDDCTTCNGTKRADPHSPTRIASRLALIHCEISEAVECVARGRMELCWKLPPGTHLEVGQRVDCKALGGKPEGFPIELADVFLRVCDLAESLGVVIPEFGNSARVSDCEIPEEIAAELAYLHQIVVRIQKAPTEPRRYGDLCTQLYFLGVWTGVDLLVMAELKHEYNKTRPIMHGGKLL